MTITAKKSKKQVRVYLDAEEEGMLSEAMKSAQKLAESDLMTMLTSAALRALKDNNYRITLPLKLRMLSESETEHYLNERRGIQSKEGARK